MLWSFQSKATLSADTAIVITNRNFGNLPTAGPTYQCGNVQVTFSSITFQADGTFSATIASSGTVGTCVPQGAYWYGPVPVVSGGAIGPLAYAGSQYPMPQGPAPPLVPLL